MSLEHDLHSGGRPLADVELLAVVLGGVRSPRAMSAAAALLDQHGSLHQLVFGGPHAWREVPGVGAVRAARLHAAIELGRRSTRVTRGRGPVGSPQQAYTLLGPGLRGLHDEELHALFLDRRRRVVAQRCLTRGSDAFTVVDPRQVFRVAVTVGASALVLAHNHPSGDPTPSAMDRQVTRRVAAAGRVLGIVLLDHLVVGAEGYTSLAEQGVVPVSEPQRPSWTA